jgi:SAM-dependent methyltransferase
VSDEIQPEAQAFGRVPELYDRARPEYPEEAVALLRERLGLGPGRRVLDLAAGTGKLTRPLVATGADVVAVEPVAGMRALLPESVEALDGTAESIPLPDLSVDAVTVAQAFHWFRAQDALREIHRVLRPDGALALVWNTRDADDPLQRDVSTMMRSLGWRGRRENLDVAAELRASDLFGPVEESRLPHEGQALTRDGVVERFLSESRLANAVPAERDAFEQRLRERLAAESEPILVPYVTEIFVAPRA